MLQIRLLGQFDVRSAGKRIDIPSRAGQSLLAYLLLNAGTPQRRERLAGLLWPDTSDENARHNLRTELWRIRKALGSRDAADHDYLLSEDLTVTFNPEAQCWLDVNQLQQPISADGAPGVLDDLIGQLTLYQGELLPGFYDEWIVLERERLQALFERDMKRLLERLCQEQRWATVLEWSERWIALGQTPEPAYRALMAAYAALGDRAKAVATFERCRAALEQDLDVEPSPETQALYDRLLRGEVIGSVDLAAAQVAPVRVRQADEPPAPGEPPFKGLQYFDEADADLFFGRELLTAQLVQHLREANFLAVIVGASGSGKSSVMRAGLIPALKNGKPLADGTLPLEGSRDWRFEIITPTAHPLEALAAALTRDSESVTATATLLDDLAREPRSLALFSKRLLHAQHTPRLVLVIDQFEELFTLCRDEFEREAFIDNLLTALTPAPLSQLGRGDGGEGTPSPAVAGEGRGGGSGVVTLILTLRADFYAYLAQYPELREAVARQQEYIGPMTADELRRAVEEPARRGEWEFEPGLVDLILRDVGDEPGALPLLSHALLETWQRRSGRIMTLKGYADAGGVRGAIACTAEAVYQRLSAEQQEQARHLFLELTELGEGTEDTRRRVKIDELVTHSEQVRALLTTLADARLITTGEETVEVAHEALIREWPRLRDWLNEDREGLRLHRHLGEAAHDWELLEYDAGALYRGARLSQANEWAAANENALSVSERAFLAASNELEQHEAAEREAQRQRELDAALKLAETEQQAITRLRRRNRVIAAAGALVTVAALIAILLAGQANMNATRADQNAAQAQTNLNVAQANAATAQAASMRADQQRAEAVGAQATAEAERLRAEDQARLARARELAAAAMTNRDSDPELAILLALQSLSETYNTAGTMLPETQTALHQALQASRVELTLTGPGILRGNVVVSAVFSPDGRHAATANQDDGGWVWDLNTGRRLRAFVSGDLVIDVAYSPDGSRLATAAFGGKVTIFDATTGDQLLAISENGTPQQVAFTPDGKRFVVANLEGTVTLRDASTGDLQRTLAAHPGPINGVAFTPDGARLATAGADGTAKIWDTDSGDLLLTLSEDHSSTSIRAADTDYVVPGMAVEGITYVAFSPDGRYLATASTDGTVTKWDAATGQRSLVIPAHPGGVMSVAYSPDGTRLATAGLLTAIVWDAMTGERLLTLNGHADWINDLAFNADGTQLVTASSDGTARVWDITPEGRSESFFITGNALAYSPDGTRLATANPHGGVSVWDTAAGRIVLTLQAAADTGKFNSLIFSPDGKRLAAGAENGAVYVWETGGKLLATLHDPENAASVLRVAFSPDGRQLAAVNGGKGMQLWDVETGKRLDIPSSAVAILSVAYSQNADALLATSGGGGITLRQPSTGGILFLPYATRVLDVAFSPDGRRVAGAGQDGVVKIWDASSLENPTAKPLLSFVSHAGSMNRVAFSPDGQRLATAGEDHTVRLWNAATGAELLNLPGADVFSDVAFSPDGRYLATAQANGAARLYLLPIDELAALARTRVTRSLTMEECQKYLHVNDCPAP